MRQNIYTICVNNNVEECCLDTLILEFLKYIKSKKSSFYKICCEKITQMLPIRYKYLSNDCNIILKLLDIYYKYNGTIVYYELFLWYDKDHFEIHSIKNINISSIKNIETNEDCEINEICVIYTYYKHFETHIIKSIDLNTLKLDYINLLIFTIFYSVKYNNIELFTIIINKLLNDESYYHYLLSLFFTTESSFFTTNDILKFNASIFDIDDNNKYLVIILQIINNECFVNDLRSNIEYYTTYIKKFINIKNDTKLYLSIKNIIVESNILDTIEYNI